MEFNARHGFVGGHRPRADEDAARRSPTCAASGWPTASCPRRTDLGPAALLARLASALRDAHARGAACPFDRLLAVGAGAPGAVDRDRGMAWRSPRTSRAGRNVPMAAILRRAPRRAGGGRERREPRGARRALAGRRARPRHLRVHHRRHRHRRRHRWSTAQLHRGHHFLAGEIGLMCMGPQYVDLDFGARGCLETLAGLKALAARWPHAPEAATPTRWVAELLEAAKRRRRGARRRWTRRRCSSGSRWRT